MALLTLVSVDRVVCADGCTESRSGIADSRIAGDADEDCDSDCDCTSGHATIPDRPHECVLCTSGLEAPVALPTLSPLGIIGRLPASALPIATSVPPPLLDHPPRSFAS
jgi:hypothetical protein